MSLKKKIVYPRCIKRNPNGLLCIGWGSESRCFQRDHQVSKLFRCSQLVRVCEGLSPHMQMKVVDCNFFTNVPRAVGRNTWKVHFLECETECVPPLTFQQLIRFKYRRSGNFTGSQTRDVKTMLVCLNDTKQTTFYAFL